jgi:hypothetical protein
MLRPSPANNTSQTQVDISVFTDRSIYVEVDPVRISGHVASDISQPRTTVQEDQIVTITPPPQKIEITVKKDRGDTSNNLSVFSNSDGSYNATITVTKVGL